jgi:hypothetical protein
MAVSDKVRHNIRVGVHHAAISSRSAADGVLFRALLDLQEEHRRTLPGSP